MASSELTKQLGAILNSANPTLDSEDPAINALFIQFGANLISNVDQRVLAIRNRLAPGSLTTLSDLVNSRKSCAIPVSVLQMLIQPGITDS